MSSSDSFVIYTPETLSEADDLVSQLDDSFSLRSKGTTLASPGELELQIHPLDAEDGDLLISTQQPARPDDDIEHVPCDIVLVIDVSGSMGASAPMPDAQDQNSRESSGLTILDLTKHAARTILESLNEGDRLGIVTFDNKSTVVQDLQAMTEETKKKTREKIRKLQPGSSTNLWSGIRSGLDLFKDDRANVQGLYILTDGMPNYMCPPQGYVPKLKPILEETARQTDCVPSIHTFGFGYNIRSGLMQSIAETGGGNYAFIPDAGMIGTVFVHAVANLFSTYAVSAKLNVETNDETKLLYSAGIPSELNEWGDITLDIGNLQFGQSRNIVVNLGAKVKKGTIVNAKLACRLPDGTIKMSTATITMGAKQNSNLDSVSANYHLYRHRLTSILSSLFPTRADGEHIPKGITNLAELEDSRKSLVKLSTSIRSSQFASDINVNSLSEDINGKDPAGQVVLALSGKDHMSYWVKWGQHYLPSLLHAHMRQVCNTFKDPGPLRYGVHNMLFTKCRNRLDEIFDKLPPPEPTPSPRGGPTPQRFVGSMRRFNSSSNPCFNEGSQVMLADGTLEYIEALRTGTKVWTLAGGRKIHAILRTDCESHPICRIGELWITPWHPVIVGRAWRFPAEVADEVVISSKTVYSLVLDESSNPEAHTIKVSGQVATTLGHGIVQQKQDENDCRAHMFFGSYEQVMQSLSRLSVDAVGHFICGGVERCADTGLASGFMTVQYLTETETDMGASMKARATSEVAGARVC